MSEEEADFLFISYKKLHSIVVKNKEVISYSPNIGRVSYKKPREHPDEADRHGIPPQEGVLYKRLRVSFDPFEKIGSLNPTAFVLCVFTNSESGYRIIEEFEFVSIFDKLEEAENKKAQIESTLGKDFKGKKSKFSRAVIYPCLVSEF